MTYVYLKASMFDDLNWCWDDEAKKSWWEKPDGTFFERSAFTPQNFPQAARALTNYYTRDDSLAVEEGL